MKKLIIKEHNIDLMPDSEAERYFINAVMPICKDEVACQLGELFSRDFNRYIMSHRDYKLAKPLINVIKYGKFETIGVKDIAVIASLGLLVLYLGYLSKGRQRASSRGCWAEFEDGLKVRDEDVTDFVINHLDPKDWLDPYAITSGALATLGIYKGFGGDEPIPEGKWYFFKDC